MIDILSIASDGYLRKYTPSLTIATEGYLSAYALSVPIEDITVIKSSRNMLVYGDHNYHANRIKREDEELMLFIQIMIEKLM